MTAVLFSSHEEVARIPVEELGELGCMASNPDAEDLIKIICVRNGKPRIYWCDSIEFIKD